MLEKVAAIGESLIVNYPFIDGNKRTGFLVMVTLLIDSGFTLTANQDNAYEFIIKISTGEMRFDEILIWVKENTVSILSLDILA